MRYFLLAAIAVLFLSCQKEISLDLDNPNPIPETDAVFTFSGAPNACTGATINGAYILDTDLSSANTVIIEVNVASIGSYSISTDSVNGYKFSASGAFDTVGIQNITLTASGKPVAVGTDSFTPQAESPGCTFHVTVVEPTPAAFTLAGAPNACAGATINGTYLLNAPLSAANTVDISVNVTSTGPFTITTNTVGGITFSATGAFTTTGNKTVTLTGSGTPTAQGANIFTPQVGNTSCTFSVNVLGAATFTMGDAPGACSNPVINGSYVLGTPLDATNTVIVSVNVTTPGTFTLSTNSVGGMTFSKTGVFTTTGVQSVTLAGAGTPTIAGANVLAPQPGACTFTINVTGPAAFAFSGTPGACLGGAVSGNYTVGTPLTTANTVALEINVTSVGSYNISTASVGGMRFSKSGMFTTTGLQTVLLTGSGTPENAGVTAVSFGTNGCTFDVNVVMPTATYSCKVDGVLMTFNDRARAEVFDDFYDPARPYLYLNGYTGPPNGSFVPEFQIFITNYDNSAVRTGSYNTDGYLNPTAGYRLEIDYHGQNPDASVTIWNTASSFLTPNPPFSVVITSRTATRITGTFSGTVTNTLQGSTLTKTITEGVFDLPIY